MQFNYQATVPCPNCKRLKLRELSIKSDKLESQYGEMPADEFIDNVIKLKKEIDSTTDTDFESETLFEHVVFNTDDTGEFKLSYTCECNVCGFTRTIDKIDPDITYKEDDPANYLWDNIQFKKKSDNAI